MTLNNEEEAYFKELEQQLQNERAKSTQYQREYTQQSMFPTNSNPNSIQYQLDPSEEMNRIINNLQSKRIVTDNTGFESWADPLDPSSRVLSDQGVDMVSSVVSFLINKNIILSNFETEEIDKKMWRFGVALARVIYMNCEKIFYKPDVELLIERDMRLVHEIESKMNIQVPEGRGELYNALKLKLDYVIAKRIQNIQNKTVEDYEEESASAFKYNKSKYELLHTLILQSVHATYNRAWRGGERQSIHTSRHVSENINPPIPFNSPQLQRSAPKPPSLLKPWTWNNRR